MGDKNLVLYAQPTTGKGGDGDKNLVLYAQSTTGKGGDEGQESREGTWFFTPSQPREREDTEDKHLVDAIL